MSGEGLSPLNRARARARARYRCRARGRDQDRRRARGRGRRRSAPPGLLSPPADRVRRRGRRRAGEGEEYDDEDKSTLGSPGLPATES